jgi:hypothetical protein
MFEEYSSKSCIDAQRGINNSLMSTKPASAEFVGIDKKAPVWGSQPLFKFPTIT